ncbi:MAG: hypothetical protein ACRDRK_19600, partial [Pseudonocardia sp.]
PQQPPDRRSQPPTISQPDETTRPATVTGCSSMPVPDFIFELARNRRDNALDVLLDAETLAPEQVRHHFLSRRLVAHWMKTTRGPVSSTLADFAHRLCLSG